ncbi:MAG: trehalose-phosphatase [Sphingorhabdus sp.]
MLSTAKFLQTPPSLWPIQPSLFLDFDGTLVELVDSPEAIIVDPTVLSLLQEVRAGLIGRVALVSGRSVKQLDRFLGTAASDLAMVGSHGAEIRVGPNMLCSPARPLALQAAEQHFKEEFDNIEGVGVEVKSFGVAIHYRLAPAAEENANKAAAIFAKDNGLELQHGKMMVEVRTSGHDKGSGIATLMSMMPFTGHTPIFVGDDLTDEAGFEMCEAMGGFGVMVGPARETAARYRLRDVPAVHEWLAAT